MVDVPGARVIAQSGCVDPRRLLLNATGASPVGIGVPSGTGRLASVELVPTGVLHPAFLPAPQGQTLRSV